MPVIRIFVAGLAALAASVACAQSYPSKLVRIVVPTAPPNPIIAMPSFLLFIKTLILQQNFPRHEYG